MSGHEAAADQLLRLGVRTAFGLVGDDVARLAQRLWDRGVRYIGARHENQAVAMADTFARTSETPGVVVLAGGPGVSNGLTAINTAHRANSRVLVVTGTGSAVPKPFALHEVCAGLGIPLVDIHDASVLLGQTRDAYQLCASGRTVVVSYHLGALDAESTEAPSDLDPAGLSAVGAVEPDAAQVSAICELLEDQTAARRPVIIAGAGAVDAGAGPALRSLADRIGAVLLTTLKAPGLFSGDPYDLGLIGTYASGLAVELVRRADLILVFGASLNRFTTYDGELVSRCLLVHVDSSPAAFGRNVPTERELCVNADARLTAEAFVRDLDNRGVHPPGYRSAALRDRIRSSDATEELVEAHAPGRVDPRVLALSLDKVLPTRRTLVYDGGRHQNYMIPYLRADGPSRFIQMSSAGSIGLALGGAIGAALGDRQRLAVACVGDASFMMALNDLETAAREQIPMLVIVNNDGALGAEVRYLEMRGKSVDVARATTPDLAAVARALGAAALDVRQISDLAGLPDLLAQARGPTLLDCHINADVPAPSIDFLFSAPMAGAGESRSPGPLRPSGTHRNGPDSAGDGNPLGAANWP